MSVRNNVGSSRFYLNYQQLNYITNYLLTNNSLATADSNSSRVWTRGATGRQNCIKYSEKTAFTPESGFMEMYGNAIRAEQSANYIQTAH